MNLNKNTMEKNMAKNKMFQSKKEVELEDDFDLSDFMESSDNEAMASIMAGLVEASNNQMKLAIELTKLAVEKNAAKGMNEDEVFSIFKKASAVIDESNPLKAVCEKFMQ
jgi:hypothetical protein